MYLKAWRKATLNFFMWNVYIFTLFFFLLVDRILTAVIKKEEKYGQGKYL